MERLNIMNTTPSYTEKVKGSLTKWNTNSTPAIIYFAVIGCIVITYHLLKHLVIPLEQK